MVALLVPTPGPFLIYAEEGKERASAAGVWREKSGGKMERGATNDPFFNVSVKSGLAHSLTPSFCVQHS